MKYGPQLTVHVELGSRTEFILCVGLLMIYPSLENIWKGLVKMTICT